MDNIVDVVKEKLLDYSKKSVVAGNGIGADKICTVLAQINLSVDRRTSVRLLLVMNHLILGGSNPTQHTYLTKKHPQRGVFC